MATRSIHDTIRYRRELQIATITGSALNTGDVDTQGFDSVMFVVDFGDDREFPFAEMLGFDAVSHLQPNRSGGDGRLRIFFRLVGVFRIVLILLAEFLQR